MNTMMRKTMRRGVVAMGGLALALGAAACSGGSDEADSSTAAEKTSAESAAEDAGEDAAAAEDSASDAGGDAAASDDTSSDDASSDDSADSAASGPLSDADLTAASQSFIDFVKAATEGDSDKACQLILDPSTGGSLAESNPDVCASSFESMGGSLKGQDASMFTTESVTATDAGDGKAAISFSGQDMGISMVKGSSGTWLLDTGSSSAG